MSVKRARTALISVFNKERILPVVNVLHDLGIQIYATGGTETFIKEQEIPVIPVEDVTKYPSILGGRVKTLHPKIFGGILNRRENNEDKNQVAHYEIPELDIIIVDLYPFKETLKSEATHEGIIEKIDIGGIALLRAAAKNFQDVVCVSSYGQYEDFLNIITEGQGATNLVQRRFFAAQAFGVTSAYDTAIFEYLNEKPLPFFRENSYKKTTLRYGENPHQKGSFYGDLGNLFDCLHGKALSFNNLLDVDAAVELMLEFDQQTPTFAILKHNNPCGVAQRDTLIQAYKDALAGDPVSAFGGVLIANSTIDKSCAQAIDKLFFQVVIAPDFQEEGLEILKRKNNRILLKQKRVELPKRTYRTALNGILCQERNDKKDTKKHLKNVTKRKVSESEIADLLFAAKICKHTKSNAIVLTKNKQLYGAGTGQTSRVDALKQAIEKAKRFGFDLNGAAMASDAFFPFPDCVEIAHKEGVKTIIQPGGSVKDALSVAYCDENDIGMIFTGNRHFKH